MVSMYIAKCYNQLAQELANTQLDILTTYTAISLVISTAVEILVPEHPNTSLEPGSKCGGEKTEPVEILSAHASTYSNT